MRMIIAGEHTGNIIDAVQAYANKRVEDALKVAAETSQELTKAIVQSYDRRLDDMTEYVVELEAEVDALQDEVCNLVDDNRELLQEIAELRRVLDMVVNDRTELHKIIEDMQEALAEYRVKEALGEYYKYLEKGEAETETEEKEQPACCAAGHCGTDECEEHCIEEGSYDSLEDLLRAMFK
ncbi:MAG: hypothetical protein J6B87_03420 [Clostridia bacterium]|nr:hypothetical protein [Clostridia bacterium]